VQEGSFGGVSLDGLNFSIYGNWPGAIDEGNGEALILVDSVPTRSAPGDLDPCRR
jgi:hypothetical protein